MRQALTLVLLLGLGLAARAPLMAASLTPAEGEPFPEVLLPAPEQPDLRRYLGLTGGGTFGLGQVAAEVVIVEIFSMYCPHCQRAAPAVNQAHGIIEADPRLKGRVKLVGIGAGNSAYEVEIFRKKYTIPFPLFADEDFRIHELLGEVRTPYFIGFRIQGDGTREVIYSRLGMFADPKTFVETIAARAALK